MIYDLILFQTAEAANGALYIFSQYMYLIINKKTEFLCIRVIQFLLTSRFCFCVCFSRGMAKLLQKRKTGRASYKVCTLFQLLEKEGKDKIYSCHDNTNDDDV